MIVAALGSCASPGSHPTTGVDDDTNSAVLPLQLDLPPRFEAWRKPLLQEWATMNQRFPAVAARWPRDSALELPKFRVVVPENSEAAYAFYRIAGLEGDPSVPRTFPGLGLAVVPLPRNDALLADLSLPMKTWMHGFRHECAHLLSLDRPGLRAAPGWFQEGFAELWCPSNAGESGALTELSQAWPYWGNMHLWWSTAKDAPVEAQYTYSAGLVAMALATDAGPSPWPNLQRDQWASHAELQFTGLRGRHADWDVAAGRYLLATRPGQHVDLDLPKLWDGRQPLQLHMQIGRSPGKSEAGLVLFGSGVSETRIRLRYGLGGGFAAYVEEGETAGYEAFALPNERDQLGVARNATLRMDGTLLHVEMLDFERTFDLEKLNLQLPLRIRMVVRDGAFLLHTK
ncbi:MAG: hypothetical protein O3A95_04935 [Planctomycetota bacterium]|nr:hypothetical protein [Planctomycetota bacterium]